MPFRRQPILSKKKKYLQIALNGTLSDAQYIISKLPRSDQIILEAGTPLIKRHGIDGIRSIRNWYEIHLAGQRIQQQTRVGMNVSFMEAIKIAKSVYEERKTKQDYLVSTPENENSGKPYIVADLKMMDRGSTEVSLAAEAGATAAVALGLAPVESIDSFILECKQRNIDSMIDMMNVDFPVGILRELKEQPDVVILHRGVDETEKTKDKMLPLHEIRRIKGAYDVLVSVAGGDTAREIQSTMFNDADIAVVWKDFYNAQNNPAEIASNFLEQIK